MSMDPLESPYVVVEFLDEEENVLSEVPSNWMEGENYCWWPKTKDITSLITKRVDPIKKNGKWTKFPVQIHLECDTYKKARRTAANQSMSDSADERLKGRGQRKKIPISFPDADSDSETPSQLFSYTKFPDVPVDVGDPAEETSNESSDLVEEINNEIIQIHNVPDETHKILDDILVAEIDILNENNDHPVINEIIEPHSSQNTDVLKSMKKHMDAQFNKTFAMLAKIQLSVDTLMEKENAEKPTKTNFHNVCRYLPLSDIDKMKEFEVMIMENDFMTTLKEYFRTIGGSNLKEKLIRILKRTFSNTLLAQTSWSGQRNNYKMSDLRVLVVVKDVVSSSQDFDEKIFEDIISDWIRQAKQRLRREQTKNAG